MTQDLNRSNVCEPSSRSNRSNQGFHSSVCLFSLIFSNMYFFTGSMASHLNRGIMPNWKISDKYSEQRFKKYCTWPHAPLGNLCLLVCAQLPIFVYRVFTMLDSTGSELRFSRFSFFVKWRQKTEMFAESEWLVEIKSAVVCRAKVEVKHWLAEHLW